MKIINLMEVHKEKLTEKQINAFSSNMVDDPTDYNGARQIYITKDGRYEATLNVKKYKSYFKVKDLLKHDIQDIEVQILELKNDIELDVKEGITDFIEEDKTNLIKLENQLNKLQKLL